jgi:hypothetical protein
MYSRYCIPACCGIHDYVRPNGRFADSFRENKRRIKKEAEHLEIEKN